MKLLLTCIVALGTATSIVSYFVAFRAPTIGDRRNNFSAIARWSSVVVLITLCVVALEYRTSSHIAKGAAIPSGAERPHADNEDIVVTTPSGQRQVISPCTLETQFAPQADKARRDLLIVSGDAISLVTRYAKDLSSKHLEPTSIRVFFYRKPDKLEWVDLEMVKVDAWAALRWGIIFGYAKQLGQLNTAVANGRLIKDIKALPIEHPASLARTLNADLLCENNNHFD